MFQTTLYAGMFDIYIKGVWKLYLRNVKASKGEQRNKFCIEIWLRKRSVETVNVNSSLNKNTSLAWIVILRTYFEQLPSLYPCGSWRHLFHGWGYERNGATAQRIYKWNDSWERICRIAEHFSVFLECCARVGHIMLWGPIKALENLCSIFAVEAALRTVKDSLSTSSIIVYVCWVCACSLLSPISIVQWNVHQQASHWWTMRVESKSVQGMTSKVSKCHSSAEHNNILYCINAVFLPPAFLITYYSTLPI